MLDGLEFRALGLRQCASDRGFERSQIEHRLLPEAAIDEPADIEKIVDRGVDLAQSGACGSSA
jgi:hypothetical protein